MQTVWFTRPNRRTTTIAPRGLWTSCAAFLVAAVVSFWPTTAESQSPGAIDSTFNAGVIDGAIRGLAVQLDSKIVVVGEFTQIGGASRQHVARLNSEGSVDDSFVPAPELWFSPSNRVTHVALQSNGSVLLGGHFELNYPGSGTNTTACLVRLTSAGNLDWSFGPVTIEPLLPALPAQVSPGTMLGMALQSDDKTIIGYDGCSSYTSTLPGQVYCWPASVVRRVSADGQPDPTFDTSSAKPPGVGLLWSIPRQIFIDPSGSSVILWNLNLSGNIVASVQRLDPQGAPQFAFGLDWVSGGGLGPGWPSIVDTIGLAEDGSIWVGGAFAIAGRTMGLARTAADGNWDATVKSSTGEVFDMLPLPSRRVLVSAMSGQTRALQRLVSTGQVDPAWHTTTFPNTTLAMAQQQDGKVLVGGGFSVGGHQNLIRFFCDDRTPRAPVILQAPMSQRLDSTNQPVTLFVRAEGYPYPSYQWFKNGAPLPGQTNDAVIAPVQFASYYVVVSNALGTVTSPEIQTTVRRIPTLAEALNTPDWQYTAVGTWQVVTDTASHDGIAAVSGTTPKIFTATYGTGYLKTTVQGPGTLSFWMTGNRGEFNVNGQRWGMTANTSAWDFHRYVLPAGTLALQWSVWQPYSVSVEPGTITLDQVEFQPLQPSDAIRILSQPQPRSAVRGGVCSLQVQAESQLPVHYQWFYSMTNQYSQTLVVLEGATNANLVLAPVTISETGLYRVAVTNESGGLMSQPALVQVSPAANWTSFIPSGQPALASPDGQWVVWPYYYSRTGLDWFCAVSALTVSTGSSRYVLQIPLPFHTYPFIPLAISPDSKTLAVGTPSGVIQLLTLASATQAGVVTNGVSPISSLAFSPAGEFLAAGTTDAVVRVWRMADGSLSQLVSWTNRPGSLAALTFSPGGESLAADCGHRTVVWNLADGAGREPDPDWDPQGWIGYSPDGSLLASRTQVRSTADWREVYRFEPGLVSEPLAFSQDGRMLVYGGTDGARILWIEPGSRIRLLEGYRYWGRKAFLAFPEDGKHLILDATPESGGLVSEPIPVLASIVPSFDPRAQLLDLQVQAMRNSAYTLQVSPDLQHWQDWTNGVVNGTAGSPQSKVEAARPAQFYRARMN